MQHIDTTALAICLIFVVVMVALSIVAAADKVQVSPFVISAAVAGVVAVVAALVGKKPQV